MVSLRLGVVATVVHVMRKEFAVGDCGYSPIRIHFTGLPHSVNGNDGLAATWWASDNH